MLFLDGTRKAVSEEASGDAMEEGIPMNRIVDN